MHKDSALAGLLTTSVFPDAGGLSHKCIQFQGNLKQPGRLSCKRGLQHLVLDCSNIAAASMVNPMAPGGSSSSDLRMHTPDVEDFACLGLRKRACRTAGFAASSAYTTPAASNQTTLLPDKPTQHNIVAEVLTAATADADVKAALEAAAELSGPPVTPGPQARLPVQPFSLGVMFEAYHNHPTPNMPGYPSGFWSVEPSPFAAFALQPLAGP